MAEWFRSATTGDRGFMVEEGDKQFIQLDRPNQVIKRIYKERDWIAESEHRPLLPQQIGRILFETEKYLLIALGDSAGREMDWEMMTNLQRSEYMEEDSEFELVRNLHESMDAVLRPLCE